MRTFLTVLLTAVAVLVVREAFDTPTPAGAVVVSATHAHLTAPPETRLRIVRVAPIHLEVPKRTDVSLLRVTQRIEWQAPAVGITRQLSRVRESLRACARERSMASARVVGDVRLSLRVDGEGKVADLNPMSERFGARERAFLSCVAVTLQPLEFPNLTEPAEVLLKFRRDGSAYVAEGPTPLPRGPKAPQHHVSVRLR